jgi:ABC-2 type transport system ATP-binding protein
VLVTSHILGEIERVADRVAILLGGRLLGVHALAGPAAGQRMRLRVRGPADAVRACLTRVPGVMRVHAEGEPRGEVALCVVDAGAGPVAEALASAVVTAGFGLVDMTPAPVDLEALFLELTGGQPEAHG